MKKKGFTLVELLAVIVILAIIALIATPIILGVIETSKKGASENSALGYLDAVEKQIARNLLDEDVRNDIKNRAYSVEELKNLGVKVKGSEPSNGIIEIKNGEVKNYILGIDGYAVENGKATKPSNTKKYENGYDVYYNPVSGEKCSASDAVSTTGKKDGCMKWYVFNDSEGASTVNVILYHNTTAKVAWNSSGSNETGMKEVLDSLTNDTTGWKVPARLITANEVAKITNHTTFDSNKTGQTWYCLATNIQDATGMPYCNKYTNIRMNWLFDYTDCTYGPDDWGCIHKDASTYGYWTSTPYTGKPSGAWNVDGRGALNNGTVSVGNSGVRPVITISKSKLS